MNIGIISPSEIARRRFLPALGSISGAQFCGVGISSYTERCAVREIRREEFAEIQKRSLEKAEGMVDAFGGRVFSSYEELINSEEIDSVYIPLPPALHYEWAKKALEAGKHVLVEKPSTLRACDTEKLIQLAEKNGLALHENYMFVFHSQLETIAELIRSGEIGSIRLIRLAFGFPKRAAGDFRYSKSMGGGALYDAGGYAVRYASMLLGSDAEIRSAVLNYEDGYDVDLYGSATMVGPDGKTAQLSFGMDNDYKCELEVWGSTGTVYSGRIFTAPAGFKPTLVIKHNQERKEIVLEDDDTFRKSIEHFMDCTKDSEAREKTYKEIHRQAVLIDQLVEAAGRSTQQHGA